MTEAKALCQFWGTRRPRIGSGLVRVLDGQLDLICTKQLVMGGAEWVPRRPAQQTERLRGFIKQVRWVVLRILRRGGVWVSVDSCSQHDLPDSVESCNVHQRVVIAGARVTRHGGSLVQAFDGVNSNSGHMCASGKLVHSNTGADWSCVKIETSSSRGILAEDVASFLPGVRPKWNYDTHATLLRFAMATAKLKPPRIARPTPRLKKKDPSAHPKCRSQASVEEQLVYRTAEISCATKFINKRDGTVHWILSCQRIGLSYCSQGRLTFPSWATSFPL